MVLITGATPIAEGLHPTLVRVTERVIDRSRTQRSDYLERVKRAADRPGPERSRLGCSNLAHGFAACAEEDKQALAGPDAVNVAIVTAYNDMLSAHQPYAGFPEQIKAAVGEVGAVAQVAGGTPAMCDGVTQGREGMELSLFSRDVIALSTAIALSHEMFDAAVCLGICDKIVPGQLIGALSFGHLPFLWIPAGPMPSGLSNQEKAEVRQRYAAGEITREQLLEAESAAYHSPGTCTFYGTANSNQMFMEILGLQLPGSSFVNPDAPERPTFTRAAGHRIARLAAERTGLLADVVDERAIINAIVGLLATGGSTNHTIHLVAIARAAGIHIDWDDFGELSSAVPLLTRVYPNGIADVNHFHRAGGLRVLIGELLDGGLLHPNTETILGQGLEPWSQFPDGQRSDAEDRAVSTDRSILRSWRDPFSKDGGLVRLEGNLGRAVIKTSAIPEDRHRIEAPAMVFDDQKAVREAFEQGTLDRDVVVVVRFQGPQANGMPELHKLMPPLGVLQDRGFRVALVTDGRLSGASGKVPGAIHVVPEAAAGGPLACVEDGDVVVVDATEGTLEVRAPLSERTTALPNPEATYGVGRELFANFRQVASGAEEGGSVLLTDPTGRP